MSYTRTRTFQNNTNPVGGGVGPALDAGVANEWEAAHQDASGRLDVIESRRWVATDSRHGIDSTGATDATAKIHALRDTAGAQSTVYFPPGTYKVSGLDLNVLRQRWILARGAVIQMAAATIGNVVNISAAGVMLEGPGTVDGNSATQTGTYDGVRVTSGTTTALSGVVIRDLVVINTTARGIHLLGATQSSVINCTATGTGREGIYAEVDTTTANNISDIVLAHNYVDRTALAPSTIQNGGIKVHASTSPALTASRVKITDNTVLLPASPTATDCIGIETWHGCPGASIAGNHIAGGQMGISVDSSDNASVVGNIVGGASFVGIEVPISSFASVTGNTVDGGGLTTYGIWVDNNPTQHPTITGNTIKGCATNAIYISATTAGSAVVVGNAIAHSGTGSAVRLDAPGCTSGLNTHTGTGTQVTAAAANCYSWGDSDPSGMRFHLFDVNSFARLISGSSVPAGFGGGRGSMYVRRGGPVGGTLFLKDTDAGSSSWAPVQTVRFKAGAPADADFEVAPADGAEVIDTTNLRRYIRVAGVWRYTALT